MCEKPVRNALGSVGTLALALLSGCAGQRYGYKPVPVTLTTEAQQQASSAQERSELSADAYLLPVKAWHELEGPARLHAIESAGRGGDTGEAERLRQELLGDLIEFHVGRTPLVDYSAEPLRSVLVVEREGHFGSREFNPLDEQVVAVVVR